MPPGETPEEYRRRIARQAVENAREMFREDGSFARAHPAAAASARETFGSPPVPNPPYHAPFRRPSAAPPRPNIRDRRYPLPEGEGQALAAMRRFTSERSQAGNLGEAIMTVERPHHRQPTGQQYEAAVYTVSNYEDVCENYEEDLPGGIEQAEKRQRRNY